VLGVKSRKDDSFDKQDFGGNYIVKVKYPKENPMMNKFMKIRTGIWNYKN